MGGRLLKRRPFPEQWPEQGQRLDRLNISGGTVFLEKKKKYKGPEMGICTINLINIKTLVYCI